MRIKYSYIFLLILTLGCHKKIDYSKIDETSQRVFSLEKLNDERHFEKLKRLPKVDDFFLKEILSKLEDNMISNDGSTTFHYYNQLKINDKKGLVIACLTSFNTNTGSLFLIIIDNNDEILDVIKLAKFIDEAGGEFHISSRKISNNEFLQTKKEIGIITDSTQFELIEHLTLKFNENKFEATIIDSTYKETKY